jgi:transcriptional regulator with PAS, ATPase and Fis domain
VQQKAGLLETADGGTVFLDEIGEMSLGLQVKLLRVLEERRVLRVGGLKSRPIDVRFVAATNRDLEAEVARGAFRQDLFFRLNGISLVIPPLRERVAEIEPLAKGFLRVASKDACRAREPKLGGDALAWLRAYTWPGNIRELRNVIERAVLLSTEDAITLEHLPVEKMGSTLPTRALRPRPLEPPDQAAGLKGELEAVEHQRILDALAQCAGNQTQAAKVLGISRGTLLARLERYGLPRPRKKG